jgi:NADH-quinone oxidoreductase subunit L
MFLIFANLGTLDFVAVREAAGSLPFGGAVVTAICLLLFLGCVCKSAQIPLYVWLPDAMAGPTPVSALIHAATMVTAGVYMIGRNAVLFSHAPETLTIVAIIGAATAFFAGTVGLVQTDIKRGLAYSTVSLLGYMFLAMGVGAYTAGIFHLYTHAFFKALLFLGSGAVIHALHGEQDLRNMGGLKKELPITYWTFVIGALAIAGVPGLSGFFSKDEILYRTFASGHTILWIGGLVTSLMTAVYMFRLVFLAFHGERRGAVAHAGAPADAGHPGSHAHGGAVAHLHDAPPAMALALVVLAIGSVLAGYVGVPHAIGGANRLEAYLAPSFTVSRNLDGPIESASESGRDAAHKSDADAATELTLMGISSVLAVGGIGIALFFFLLNRGAADRVAASAHGLRTLLLNKYYVDELYDATIVQPIHLVAEEGLWKRVDAGLIDGTVNGVGEAVGGLSGLLRRLQTGSVRTYAASLLFGAVLILGYYLWP